MDLQRWFLLALVLLGIAICSQSLDCEEIIGNGCSVTGVHGNSLYLECFVTTPNETLTTGIKNSSINKLYVTNILSNPNQTFIEDNSNMSLLMDRSSNRTNTSEMFYDMEDRNNSTLLNIYNTSHTRVLRNTDKIPNNCQRHETVTDQVQETWHNISKINLSVYSDINILDLSSYPSARTVVLNTYGHFITHVINAGNITNLSVSPSTLNDDDLSFISDFTGLTHLNISNNSVQSITNLEILPSLILLDLSHNTITDITIITLPESLNILNVSFNRITNMSDIIKCNLIVLDLRNNRLSHVPILEMNKLEELYLSHNNISVLEDGVFNNITSLVVLDLKNNQLCKLEDNTFYGLNRLQWLDLSNNNIVSLAPSIFQYLTNLVRISLSGNLRLGNLHEHDDTSFLFGIGQRLQVMDASRTNLTRIPSILTRSVRTLQLSKNFITTIQCGDLESFPLVQRLDLSNNILKDVEEDALGRLDFLSDLGLSDNILNSIPKSLPDQLHVLDLRFNVIQVLKNTDFLGLFKLRVLLLSWNNISVIEDGAFSQLVLLEVLDLSRNPIKSLSRTSFLGPRKLKEMYLSSLTELITLQEPLSFPAPESAHLEILNIESSPVLAAQLMDDAAALTMFHELFELNLNYCNLSFLRNDLPKYLPRLHTLSIAGNALNCTNMLWLAKWLQELNITREENINTDTDMYKIDTAVTKIGKRTNFDNANDNVTCATPENLTGRKVLSLKEEDFPDLKLTSYTLLPTNIKLHRERDFAFVPDITKVQSDMNYVSTQTIKQPTTKHPRIGVSVLDGNINKTNIFGIFKDIFINHKVLTTTQTKTEFGTVTDSRNMGIQQQNVSEPFTNLSVAERKWIYLRSYYKLSKFSTQPKVVLMNDSSSIVKDIDNHLNDSINSDAYLAHEIGPSSHPGMLVFLLVVGVILLAATVMVFSHCSRRGRGRAYEQQQDIEVTSFGASELW